MRIPEHTVVDPAILYWGTPVVLVSTTNEDGSANLAPISSAFWLGRTAVLGFGLASHSVANLRRTGEAVLALPDETLVGAVDRLALTTGAAHVDPAKRDRGYEHCADKFGRAGLTPATSDLVGAPRVAECPVAMETVLEAVHSTDHHLVTLRVRRVHVHPHLRLAGHPHRVDPDRWRPLLMSFQQFYGRGRRVHPSRLASIDEELYR